MIPSNYKIPVISLSLYEKSVNIKLPGRHFIIKRKYVNNYSPIFETLKVSLVTQIICSKTFEKMVRKCSVGGCKSNYDAESEYVSVHGFPSDEEEKQRWIDTLPNVLGKISSNTVVCVKHWPLNYQTYTKYPSICLFSAKIIFMSSSYRAT